MLYRLDGWDLLVRVFGPGLVFAALVVLVCVVLIIRDRRRP